MKKDLKSVSDLCISMNFPLTFLQCESTFPRTKTVSDEKVFTDVRLLHTFLEITVESCNFVGANFLAL